MQPGDPKNAKDAKSEKAESAETKARQGANDENVQPLVLPIVVVSDDQTEIGETPAEPALAADAQTAHRRQPGVQGDASLAVPPTAEAFGAEVRELLDRMRPQRESQLPMHGDDAALPEEDDLTLEEAVGHFVSLAENKMRELNLGEHDSGARAIGTHRGPFGGAIEHAIQRHGDHRGAPQQLSDSRARDQSSGFDGRAGSPGPAIPAGETRQGDRAAPMPRLQIFVQLADGRAMYDDAVDEAAKRLAPDYRELACAEVRQGFWEFNSERRAADYRLRGPY